MSSLRSFGTDGEVALYQAFKHSFPHSIHLLCSIHARRNLKSKFTEIGVSQATQQIIIGDIFGKQIGTQYMEGLFDAVSDVQYEEGLHSLCEKWRSLDSHKGGPLHTFIDWFMKYKSSTLREGMLRPIRVQAGLGDPPSVFMTNASESINALLKNKVEYRKNELPVFLDQLKEAIDEQEREVERAVIDRGKYRFRSDYRYLVKHESNWFKMTASQRQAHLNKVSKAVLHVSATGSYPVNRLSSTTDCQDLNLKVFAGTIHIFQMDWKRARRPYTLHTLPVLQSSLRAETFASGEKLKRLSWQPKRWLS